MNTTCPLCDGPTFEDWQFGLLRCKQCELVVDRAIWRPAANEQLNEASFGHSYEPVRSFWVRIFERLNNRRTMSRLRAASKDRGRLLEIGVGSGSLLSYARMQGYFPVGCDLSAAICRKVEQKTQVKVHCGTLDSLPNGETFDVIVMNHVLEHVSEPVAFLKAVRKRLNQNGLLHLAVPNVAAWEARLPGWNCYEPYHLLYFTPRTLRVAAEQAGLKVQHLGTHESFSGWFLAILRTLVGKRPVQAPSEEPNNSRPQSMTFVEHAYRLVMIIFGLLTYPIRRLQAWLEKGDEIILLSGSRAND